MALWLVAFQQHLERILKRKVGINAAAESAFLVYRFFGIEHALSLPA